MELDYNIQTINISNALFTIVTTKHSVNTSVSYTSARISSVKNTKTPMHNLTPNNLLLQNQDL
jgi:hypothetical protein